MLNYYLLLSDLLIQNFSSFGDKKFDFITLAEALRKCPGLSSLSGSVFPKYIFRYSSSAVDRYTCFHFAQGRGSASLIQGPDRKRLERKLLEDSIWRVKTN